MLKPTINPLPPAPNRSQAPAAFSTTADDFVAALPPFRDQLQASIDYVEYSLDLVTTAQNAAAGSASSAQASANAALTSANNAQQAFNDTLVVASAVQVSAGLPQLAGKAGSALVVNSSATGVLWSNFKVGSNASGNRTISTDEPSGGEDGDIWYQVDE